jgi:hypothetical protein
MLLHVPSIVLYLAVAASEQLGVTRQLVTFTGRKVPMISQG